MRKVLSCLIASASVMLGACSGGSQGTQEVEFTWDSFEREVSLKGKPLFEDEVMMPFAIQVFDSMLVTVEPGNDTACQLFNLNTQQRVGARIKTGNGPDEMLMPMFVGNGEEVRMVDLPTYTLYEYNLNHFLTEALPKPERKLRFSENVDAAMQMLGDSYIGYQYAKDSLLYLFDASGKKVRGFAAYPSGSENMPVEERSDTYQMGYASNGTDRVAVTYFLMDRIELLDGEGKLMKVLKGPEGSGDTGSGKDTYFSPRSGGSSFYVLYKGKAWNGESNGSSCSKLLSFSWDGKPECVYTLDDPIFTFCVDGQKGKVYGVSTKPEYHIVEYTLPQ